MGVIDEDPSKCIRAFAELECRFAQITELDRRLVGVDKVFLFVKSIDRMERKAIGIHLEDDDGAYGLTENWAKVKEYDDDMTRGKWDSCRQRQDP